MSIAIVEMEGKGNRLLNHIGIWVWDNDGKVVVEIEADRIRKVKG